MRSFLLISVFVQIVHGIQSPCLCKSENRLGYYWRDYFGRIPSDAVIGGMDRAGIPTYVGQVYIKNFELLPATIYHDRMNVTTAAYNTEMHSNKNIKILCSSEVEKLSWVVTKYNEIHLLGGCHLVIGGTEVDHILYIGRANYDGETIIGRVFSNREGYNGLWIPHNGHEVHFKSFEILTYNCHRGLVDVRSGNI